MTKRNKILSGVLALSVGLIMAMPMRASADESNYHHHHHHWHWDRDNDHYRATPYEDHYRATPYQPTYAYPSEHRFAYGNRVVPENGEGMINRRNPNLYWACDSDGHHCHWARR